MEQGCCTNEVAELFQLEIDTSAIKELMDKGEMVNTFFSQLEGYVGLEVFLLNETTIYVLLRWKNSQFFEQHLAQILNSFPITDWFLNAKNVKHQPIFIKGYNGLTKPEVNKR